MWRWGDQSGGEVASAVGEGADNAGKIHLGTFNHPPVPSSIHLHVYRVPGSPASFWAMFKAEVRWELIWKERKLENTRLDPGKPSTLASVQIPARRGLEDRRRALTE